MEALNLISKKYPELSGVCKSVREYKESRLWHQLTKELEVLVAHRGLLASSDRELLALFDGLIKNHQSDMNPMSFSQIALKISIQANDPLDFVQRMILPVVAKDVSAKMFVEMGASRYLLSQEDQLDAVFKRIKEAKESISEHGFFFFPTVALSAFYEILFRFHTAAYSPKHKVYKAGLRFLTFSKVDSLDRDFSKELALGLAEAALTSEKIYNFGELMNHEILAVLKENYREVFALVETVNSGIASGFETTLEKATAVSTRIAKAAPLIREKMKISSLVELIFRKPGSEHTIPFAEMLKELGIKTEGELEYVILRAMSRDLIKGKIDQVGKKLVVHWVYTRVLVEEQLSFLKQRVDSLALKVDEKILLLENNEGGILT